MPIYEYQCEACGYQFEAIQRLSDQPLRDCPRCEAKEVRKLVSAAAFHLKGTGWYETDFKNKGKPSKSDSPDGGSSEAKSDAAAKTDAPPKTETKSATTSNASGD